MAGKQTRLSCQRASAELMAGAPGAAAGHAQRVAAAHAAPGGG